MIFSNCFVSREDDFENYLIERFSEAYPEVVICQPVDFTQLLPLGTEEEVRKLLFFLNYCKSVDFSLQLAYF